MAYLHGRAQSLYLPLQFRWAVLPAGNVGSCRWSHTHYNMRTVKQDDYSSCYDVLGLPENCDQEQLRSTYINLAKKFHPDSDSPLADSNKFNQIENAYRKLQEKFTKERWGKQQGEGEYGLYYEEKKENEEMFDIEHTAPQHRQYLSYEGHGSGTPSQRHKQFQKYRAAKAAERVYEHKVMKLAAESEDRMVTQDRSQAKKIKTRFGIDRLVEDLIQESIARGDFDNLPGKGKPLAAQNYNPYVDSTTHKLNQLLIENGFSPEWILLQKEIEEEAKTLRNQLAKERMKLGPKPLSDSELIKWQNSIDALSQNEKILNLKINKYNLLVPFMHKQRIHFQLHKEAEKVLTDGKTIEVHRSQSLEVKKVETLQPVPTNSGNSIFALLGSFFK